MFASPGSDVAEVGKFINTISKGATQFVNKYVKNEKMTQENFAIVVSIPRSKTLSLLPFSSLSLELTCIDTEADEIRAKIHAAKWPCQLVIVDTPEDKYQAMCVRP